MRVVVKDKTGYTTPSTAITVNTKEAGIDFGGMTDEEIEGEIGKYVDYTPVSGSFTSEGQYNGKSNQNFSTVTGLKWRILEINNGILSLISNEVVHSEFALQGANGYNNGVLLLNNACKAMYSNNSLGATARSLNKDDIERYMTYDKTSFSDPDDGYSYGEEIVSPNRYYPNIFEYETNGAPNGSYGTKYNSSDQDNYITGLTIGGSSFKGRITHYEFTMSESTMKKQIYVELFKSNIAWLASRSINYTRGAGFNRFRFQIAFVQDDFVDGVFLYGSSGTVRDGDRAIHPVVEINLSQVDIGLTGNGGVNTPYSIEAK